MSKEQTSREYITKKKELGEVRIASDVVAAIAALAATEIDGVYSTGCLRSPRRVKPQKTGLD